MNLVRHFEVLKRGRVVLALGVLVAISLATLATFRVSVDGGPKLAFRKPETWSSATKILLTQPGFPWGRSVLPGAAVTPDVAPKSTDASGRTVTFADPSRLAYLGWIYSHFLMGDEVRTMIKHKPAGMDIQAGPLTAGGNMSAASLPIIGLTTSAETSNDARRLNDEVRYSLEEYLTVQQRRSGTPVTDRVVLSVVDRPAPVRTKGHSINLGIMAFLLIMAATVGLVYVLENVRLQREALKAGPAEPELAGGEQWLFGTDSLGDSRIQGARGMGPEQRSVR
ncbi:MAG: hypothetical protein JWQ20_1044 [Conexibacter sp.]|nr:hypothetical protein [Conexibacter sp.]